MVSVIIPTCNRREILGDCLRALAQQDHPSYEVIVIDDASTDGTVEFLRAFAAEHPAFQLRWIRNESHAGANPSRNRGIRASHAPFLAFLDSDCIARPDWLPRLLGGFTAADIAAVTGLVEDQPPANIYELTFRGTHRIGRPGPAHRLIAGNMCVRRTVLERFMLDEDRAASAATGSAPPTDLSVSGRGDEEGLHLMIRASGQRIMATPDAVVLHIHHYDRRSFFRQALKGGRSAARLVYKFHLPPRRDMVPFIAAWATLPLGLLYPALLVIPIGCFTLALAAIAYNDMALKGKTLAQTVRSFPMLVAYYHVRLWGYLTESTKLRFNPSSIQRIRLDRIPPASAP